MSNNAPSLKWISVDHLHSVRRQRLFINGHETPYFIDDSKGVVAFRTQGDRYGLYGAGMSERGHAVVLGSANRIPVLKHRAEQFAMESANA